MIKLKRAYEQPAAADGTRLLVDRIWPRNVSKEALRLDGWLKDLAPSTGLRKWFGHAPERWPEFRRRYEAELDARPDAVAEALAGVRRGAVTLVYAARDTERNNAVVLKDYLAARAGASTARGGRA